jgi:ribonucleoside-diphosphate reductase alpha chain
LSENLQPNTIDILRKRYFLKDEKGQILENFEGMCHRVARFIAQAEPDDPRGRRARIEESFFQMMAKQVFMPNSPTLFNAGTPNPMLSACFILPVDDSIRDIYKTVGDGAVIEKLGGGIGMDFSRLRPRGARTSLGGIASGPLSFMNSFQVMSETIRQGGRRRGAMMAILDVHHPEILLFIDCKLMTPPERITHLAATYNLPESIAHDLLTDLAWQVPYHGFNITVKLTDEFMEAVRRNALYPLRDPRGGSWEGEVIDPRGEMQPTALANGHNGVGLPARKVWERIVENAWRSAEPGIAFIDRINRDNPVKSLGAIHSSNPCGEYWQVDYNSCNLGSINLAKFVRGDRKAEKPWSTRIDWPRLRDAARTATRFLDHVITMSQYPIPEIGEVTEKSRPIGLGVMGNADLLLKLGIRYGRPESIAVAERTMQWIQYCAWTESAELARESGPFPELDQNREYFDQKVAQLTDNFRNTFQGADYFEPEGETASGHLEDLYRQWGVRNCHVIVEAPTGSISLIAECSSGIEPIFAFEYERQDSLGTRSYRHPAVEAWQQTHPGHDLPEYFVDASATSPEEHILIQAAFQKHVDNAVSKTANLPSSAGPQEVEKIHWLAYENGLKSVTVYVEGSREGVLLRKDAHISGAQERPVTKTFPGEPALEATIRFIVRPEFLRGMTRKIRTPFGTVYVTVNYDSQSRQITEVFVRESSGNEAWELVGRLLSLLLRARVPMEKILAQLYRTRGQNTIILDEKILTSAAQAIARTIERAEEIFKASAPDALELPPGNPAATGERPPGKASGVRGRNCPDCGRQTLYPAGGCLTCITCGYSTCGGTMT